MTSRFTAADAMASAAVSRFYGESLRLIPYTEAGYTTGGEADPSRDPADFTGTLSGSIGNQGLMGADRQSGSSRGGRSTVDRVVTVDVRDWPVQAKSGDRIKALGQPGQPEYTITHIIPEGENRLIIDVVAS